jgi:hypothetical protein
VTADAATSRVRVKAAISHAVWAWDAVLRATYRIWLSMNHMENKESCDEWKAIRTILRDFR